MKLSKLSSAQAASLCLILNHWWIAWILNYVQYFYACLFYFFKLDVSVKWMPCTISCSVFFLPKSLIKIKGKTHLLKKTTWHNISFFSRIKNKNVFSPKENSLQRGIIYVMNISKAVNIFKIWSIIVTIHARGFHCSTQNVWSRKNVGWGSFRIMNEKSSVLAPKLMK